MKLLVNTRSTHEVMANLQSSIGEAIDTVGLPDVIFALAHACQARGKHNVATSGKDMGWLTTAAKLELLAEGRS